MNRVYGLNPGMQYVQLGENPGLPHKGLASFPVICQASEKGDQGIRNWPT